MKKRNILFFLILIYFLTRLINLGKLPIFNDEAMYVNWGRQIVKNPQQNLFISLTDGQQPFFIWLTSLSYLLGRKLPLLAARLISVLSGLGTMMVLFFIGKEFLGKKWNITLPILYIIVPFTLWYDRLAIKDGFLMFLAALIFYFSAKQAGFGQIKHSLLIGTILGIALLTKSIAYFFVGLYPLTALLLYNSCHSGAPTFFKKAGTIESHPEGILSLRQAQDCTGLRSRMTRRAIFKIILALAIALLIQGIVYLSPLKTNIGPKHGVFLLSFSEFVKTPFLLFRNNFYSTILWWWQYYRFLLIPGFIGWLWLFSKKKKLWLLLSLWILLPIAFEVFLAKIYIPRYFLFTFIAFSLLVGFGIKAFASVILEPRILRGDRISFGWDSIARAIPSLQNDKGVKILGTIILILFFLPSLFLDYQILFDVKNSNLPQVERWQYFEGWPAGYGVDKLIEFFEKELKRNKVNIITENETLLPASLSLYLADNQNFSLTKAFDLEKELFFPEEYLDSQAQNFIVLNHFKNLPEDWPVKKAAGFSRVNNKSEILVYLIK